MKAKIIIPSQYRYTSIIRKFVFSYANYLGFAYNSLRDITLVVDELVNNAVEHGYKLDPGQHIEVQCYTQDDQLCISVSDFGVGFDLRNYKIPSAQDFDYYVTVRGRGLFLINSLMDSVAYDVNYKQGTRVTIKKDIPTHIKESQEYFKQNKAYFDKLAAHFSKVSGLKINVKHINFGKNNISGVEKGALCRVISQYNEFKDICQKFHFQLNNNPFDKFVGSCPFNFSFAMIPISYKDDLVGMMVSEPVFVNESQKTKMIEVISKTGEIPSKEKVNIKNALNRVKIYDAAALESLTELILSIVRTVPVFKAQKDELEYLNFQIQAQNQKFKFLYEITRTLALAFRTKDEIYRYIDGVVKNTVGQCRLFIWDYNEHGNYLYNKEKHRRVRLTEGITGWAAYTGKATLVSDIKLDSRYNEDLEGYKTAKSMLSIPIIAKSKLLAVVNLMRNEKEHNFNIVDLQTLSIFFVYIGNIIENGELYYKMNYQLEELSKLNELTTGIASIFDLDELLRTGANKVANLMQVEKCSIMLVTGDDMMIKAAYGMDETVIDRVRVKIGEGVSGWVAEKGTALLIENIDEDERFKKRRNRKYKSKSFLSVPIKLGNTTIGVVNATNRIDNRNFTKKDLDLLEILSTSVALAIKNIETLRELKKK